MLCATTAESGLHLSLPAVLLAGSAGALLGAEFGYLIGRRGGPTLLDRPAHHACSTASPRPGALSRTTASKRQSCSPSFIPIVRTVLNRLAGTVGVSPRTFTLWQVVGGLAWAVGVTLAGYGLGSRIPGIDRYLLPIIAVVVVLSLLPVLLELRRSPRVTDQP